MNNLLSYATFLKDLNNFKSSGTRKGTEYNYFDTTSTSFFKIMFYFYNEDSDNSNNGGGLLTPTWLMNSSDRYEYNSAWSYLNMNDEEERADILKDFIKLLSNINSESPWYFKEITGVDEAFNRSINVIKFEENKKISIKCLPDPFDQRIEMLLSMYREIVWSWVNKREIIPSNLRKFDMAIYIWESPIYAITSNSVLNDNTSDHTASYKLLEFHNCEIDYNSIKTGYSVLNNEIGFQKEFTIDISYDDCYEKTYNSIMMKSIGDIILTDLYSNIDHEYSNNINVDDFLMDENLSEAENRSLYWNDVDMDLSTSLLRGTKLPQHKGSKEYDRNILGNALNEVIGAVSRDIGSAAKRLFLGNIYGYSVSKMADQLSGILNGQVFTALNTVDEYAKTNIMNELHNHSLNNLAGKGQYELNNYMKNKRNNQNSINNLGNINSSKTLVNNI